MNGDYQHTPFRSLRPAFRDQSCDQHTPDTTIPPIFHPKSVDGRGLQQTIPQDSGAAGNAPRRSNLYDSENRFVAAVAQRKFQRNFMFGPFFPDGDESRSLPVVAIQSGAVVRSERFKADFDLPSRCLRDEISRVLFLFRYFVLRCRSIYLSGL